jgi:hypothetical protein
VLAGESQRAGEVLERVEAAGGGGVESAAPTRGRRTTSTGRAGLRAASTRARAEDAQERTQESGRSLEPLLERRVRTMIAS